METIQFDKNLLNFILKLHNHTAIAVQWTPTSQDEARTLLPPEYKKKKKKARSRPRGPQALHSG